jgi:hypothetical protein
MVSRQQWWDVMFRSARYGYIEISVEMREWTTKGQGAVLIGERAMSMGMGIGSPYSIGPERSYHCMVLNGLRRCEFAG